MTKAGAGSVGQRFTPPWTGSPEAAAGTGEGDDSKLPETENESGEVRPGEAAGEQIPDLAAVDPIAAGAEADDSGEDDTKEDDEECGGWWPLPPDRDVPTPTDGDGYGGGESSSAQSPVGRPGTPPGMEIPPPGEVLPETLVLPVIPDPQEPLPGLVAAAAVPVISMPVIVLPPVPPGIGGGGSGAGPRAPAEAGGARPPVPARGNPAERPVAPQATDNVVPASYRAGYGEYLRTASTSQLIAVAVPGATGIMLLTGAGGLIGYRQARAGCAIRAGGAGRFSS